MSADPTGVTTSVFAGLAPTVGSGGGVTATERDGLGIARIQARRSQAARVAELLRAQFGLEPPNEPRRVNRADVAVAGVGPAAWLATHDNMDNDFAPSLRSLLGDSAAVTDQSDGYVILRLTGPRVRATLAKLVPIDIHPRSFRVNDVAQTACGYVNVTLWRLEDTASSDAAFEIWTGRSFAVSLHEAISHAAAEFGYVRQTA